MFALDSPYIKSFLIPRFFLCVPRKNFLLIFAHLVFSQWGREWERLRWIYCLSCYYWRNFFSSSLNFTSFSFSRSHLTWDVVDKRGKYWAFRIVLSELESIDVVYLKRLFCVFKLFPFFLVCWQKQMKEESFEYFT